MKKASLVLAVLAASTSAAWAQSSVTLYGIVDAAVRYTSNANAGTSTKTMAPGGMSQSRLGINVTEDMGGGLKALVNMEHRFNSDTGTVAANDFWRQAWVGLQSNEFGQIRLGRQYNVLFDLYTSTYPSFRYSPYIEAYKPEIGMSFLARQDNMVKYLAQVGNVFAEVQVSAGEGATGAAATLPNKSMGGLVRYADGKIGAGVGYLQVTEQTGRKATALTFGGSYTMGPLHLNVGWAENKFENIAGLITGASSLTDATSPFRVGLATRGGYTAGLLGASIFNADSADIKKRTMLSFGALYQLTPQLNLGAHAWLAQQTHWGWNLPALGLVTSANTTSKANFFAVVADYAFSKRTDAYLEFDYTKLDGEILFANGAAKRGGAMVGIRHRF